MVHFDVSVRCLTSLVNHLLYRLLEMTPVPRKCQLRLPRPEWAKAKTWLPWWGLKTCVNRNVAVTERSSALFVGYKMFTLGLTIIIAKMSCWDRKKTYFLTHSVGTLNMYWGDLRKNCLCNYNTHKNCISFAVQHASCSCVFFLSVLFFIFIFPLFLFVCPLHDSPHPCVFISIFN